MANSFVLTARLVLLPPTNVKNVVQFLNSQLGQIETKVKLSVPQSTLTGLRKIEDKLRASEDRIAGMIHNMQRFNTESNRTANNIDRINRVSNSNRARSVGISYDVGSTNRQIAAIGRVSSAMGSLQKTTIKSRDEFERFGQQAAISLRRFGAFTLAAGTFIKLSNAFTAGIKEAIAFDLQMTKLSQVVGSSRQSISGLESEITKLSVNLGVSSSKIADVALTLAQAGLSAEKTRVAMEVLAKTELAPTFENIKDTGEAAIAVLAQFGGGVQSLSKDFSEINRIAAKFAVESSDLTTAISKAGGVFQTAGGSLRELLALFTSVRQTTRESADSIATGFRTIFARLQRPKTQNFLEALGIDLKDSQGLFVGPYKAIQRLSEALKDLETTDPRFAKVIEEVGGYRQISRVIPLIKQFEVAERARLEAIRSGDSLTKDAIRAQESFAIKISKVREEFLATIRAFSNDSNVKNFTDSLLRLASAFNTVLDAARPILPVLGFLGVISGGPRVSRIYTAFRREEKRTPFATGGVVPGVGNSDSVKANLTPGEFVIKKSSARKIGYDNLHAMNNHAQKFADGGRVRFANGGNSDHVVINGYILPRDKFSDKTLSRLGNKYGYLPEKSRYKKSFMNAIDLPPRNIPKNIIRLEDYPFSKIAGTSGDLLGEYGRRRFSEKTQKLVGSRAGYLPTIDSLFTSNLAKEDRYNLLSHFKLAAKPSEVISRLADIFPLHQVVKFLGGKHTNKGTFIVQPTSKHRFDGNKDYYRSNIGYYSSLYRNQEAINESNRNQIPRYRMADFFEKQTKQNLIKYPNKYKTEYHAFTNVYNKYKNKLQPRYGEDQIGLVLETLRQRNYILADKHSDYINHYNDRKIRNISRTDKAPYPFNNKLISLADEFSDEQLGNIDDELLDKLQNTKTYQKRNYKKYSFRSDLNVLDSIRAYKTSSQLINSYASGISHPTRQGDILQLAKHVTNIRRATLSDTLGRKQILYSGLRNTQELINQFGLELFDEEGNIKDIGNKLVGKSFHMKRFLSASTDKEIADGFSDKGILFKIFGEPSTKLYKATGYEQEVIFPNNQNFRIAGHLYKDKGITIVPVRPYAKGGRVGFADGGDVDSLEPKYPNKTYVLKQNHALRRALVHSDGYQMYTSQFSPLIWKMLRSREGYLPKFNDYTANKIHAPYYDSIIHNYRIHRDRFSKPVYDMISSKAGYLPERPPHDQRYKLVSDIPTKAIPKRNIKLNDYDFYKKAGTSYDLLGEYGRTQLSDKAQKIAGSKPGYLPTLKSIMSDVTRNSVKYAFQDAANPANIIEELSQVFPIHSVAKLLGVRETKYGTFVRQSPNTFNMALASLDDSDYKNVYNNIKKENKYKRLPHLKLSNFLISEARKFEKNNIPEHLEDRDKRILSLYKRYRPKLYQTYGADLTTDLLGYLEAYGYNIKNHDRYSDYISRKDSKEDREIFRTNAVPYPMVNMFKNYNPKDIERTRKLTTGTRRFRRLGDVYDSVKEYESSSQLINSFAAGIAHPTRKGDAKELARHITNIRRATLSDTLGRKQILYSGLRNTVELQNQFPELFDEKGNIKYTGNKFVDKSFVMKRFLSASTNRRVAENFAKKGNIMFRILGEPNTKLFKAATSEQELIFPNNQSFRIAGHIYKDKNITIIPIRPYAKGGRVGFADGGRTQLINGPEVFKDKLKLANKDFRKFFGFNIEELVGGRVSYTKEARDGKGNSPDGFFAGRYRSKNDAGLPEIFGNDFIGKEGLIHEGLHAIDRQARVTGKYSAASRGSRNPIAKLAASLKNEEGLRLLYLLSGVRKDDKGAAYLQTPEEIFAHIGAAYISGPRKLQQLLSENNFAPSVYKNISSTFKEVQGYVALPTIKDRIFRSKYGNVTDLAKIDPNARAISDFKALELIGPYNGPSTLLGRQKESLAHFNKVRKYVSNYPKRFSDPEAAARYRKRNRTPFFSKDFSKDYYGFGAYASKEGKRALGFGALGSILGIAGAIALTQGFAKGGEAKKLPSSGDFNDLLISHFGYNMRGQTYPVNRETKFHGRLVSPKGRHYFDLPFLRGNQLSQEFYRHQNEPNFNRDIYEGGIPSANQYKVSKKAYEDAVETMTKRLGLNPRAYTKHIIGYSNLGLNGSPTEGVFSSLSKNIYYNSSADYHTSYNTFLEEMIHALDNKGLDAGKFASQGDKGKRHPFYQLNNKIRNSYGMFEFSENMVGLERGFGSNFDFSDVMYVTIPAEITAKLIKSRLDKYNPALLPLTFGSKTTKIVDDTIEQIRKSPKSYFATGGGVPGTGNQDTIPALLTPGEFVFNKKTAQKIGYSNLERMNKIGRYATGGTVGSLGPVKMAEGGGIFSGAGGFAAIAVLSSVATGAAEELDKFGKRVFDIDNAFSVVEKAMITLGTQFYAISALVKGVGNYRGQNPLIDKDKREHPAFLDDKNRLVSPSITKGVFGAERANARINQLQERIAELNRARRVEEDVLVTPKGVGGYPGAKPYYQRQTVVRDKTAEQISLERQFSIEYQRSLELKKKSLAFDREAIAKYKATEIAITRNIKAVQNLGYVMGALTGIATIVGTTFDETTKKHIAAGRDKEAITAAGRGRAIQNAGIGGSFGYALGTGVGGALGSIYGPGGTAAGAFLGGAIGSVAGTAAGAVHGYYTGASEAKENIKNIKIAKRAARLNRDIAAANQAPDFSFDIANSGVSSLVKLRQNQLLEAKDKESVRASIGDELDSVREFLTQSARKFGTDAKKDSSPTEAIKRFNKAVKEVAEYYARFTNISLTEVEQEFEGIIKVTQKQARASEILTQTTSEAETRLRRITLISSAISQVSDSLNRFDSVVAGVSDNLGGSIGGTQYKTSNVLSNSENVTDFKKFEQILLQTASPFGETGRAAANDALNATQLINRLPTILANAANSGLLSEEGDIDTIIKKQLGENNPFAENVLRTIQQELVSSGRDVTLTKIRTDPQGFAKQLTHGIENILRPFQEAEPLINQELEKLSGGLALRRQIEFRYIDMLNSALDIRLQKEEALANAQDRPVNFASQSSVLAEQFKNIVGNATTSNNPADLGKLLTENTLRFNQLNASIAQGRPDIKDRANLELERDSVSETIERLKKGLEFIASGKQIGLIQRQLDIAKSQRETKQGFLTNFAFSDTAGRRAINKTLFNTQVVTNTGNVDAIRGDERGDVLGLAQTFKDIKLAIFGGITGQEFINNATANKFQSTGQFSPDEIDQIRKGQSSEEEKLISALEESYNRAISANEILASDMKSNQEQLIINLSNSFDTFLSELSDIFAKDNVKKAEEEVQKKEFNKSAIDEKIKTRNKVIGLNGQTLTDNEVAAARKNRGLNTQLVEASRQQSQIGRAHAAIERARKAGGPTQTVGELRKIITSDPDIRGVFGEDKIDEVLKEAFTSDQGFLSPLKITNNDTDIGTNHFYNSLRRQLSQQEEVVNAERDRISSQFAPGEIKTTNQRAFDRIYKTKRDENDNIINKGVDDVQEQESLKKLNELKRKQQEENSQASLSIPGLPGVGAFLAASSIGVTPDKPKETLQETIARVEKRKKDHEARMAYMQTDVYKDKLRREEYDRRNPKTERVYPNDPNSLSGRYAAEEKRKADSIAYNKQLVAQAYANGSLRQSILPKKDSIKPNIKELLGKSGFYVDDATASAIGDNVGAKSNSSARQNNPAIKNQEQMVKGIDKISTTTDKAYSSSKPFYDKAKGSTSHLDQFGNNLGSFGADFDKSLNRMLTLTTNFSVAANGFVTSIGTLSKAVTAYQTSFDEFKKANNAFTGATAKFVVSAGNFDTSVVSFANSSEQLIKSLDKFPSSITVEGNVKAEVILNGLEVLTKLEPGIKTIVEEAVNKALKNQNRKEKL